MGLVALKRKPFIVFPHYESMEANDPRGGWVQFASQRHGWQDFCKGQLDIVINNKYMKIESMIKKYHHHKLQTNPWHHEEEPHNNN